MKIELFALNGSYAHTNLAIRCLKTALFEAGYRDVHLSEATLRDRTEGLLAALVSRQADLYGFSCYIWNIEETLRLAADLKAVLPHCRILLGGPEVSHDPARFRLPFVDAVITGEGEAAIVTAADTVAAGKPLPFLIEGVDDKAFSSRGIHYTGEALRGSLVYYESSRGCPFSCAFCLSSATRGVRAKTAQKTLADLLEFEAFPQPLTIKLVDRTFNFDRARAKAIWQGLLSEKYTKCYHFEIAADLLDEECFDILSRFPAGKVRLEIGLQSTNAQTLAAICRKTNTAAVLAAAKRLSAMGNLHVHLDLIAGLPFEDLVSFARSFDAAYPCCHMLQLGFLKLLHGTALRERATELGISYSEAPPYTVLQTPWLSFADLHRLHGIADILDRILEKGRCKRAIPYILQRVSSPFWWYSGFLDYCLKHDERPLQSISQRDLFSLLADYGRTCLEGEAARSEFLTLLRLDFADGEVRKPPKSLNR